MKKLLPIFTLLLLLSACVTTSSGVSTVDSAIIKGQTIKVSFSDDYVRRVIGNPDAVMNNEWHYKGKKENEPSFILYMANGNVNSITKIEPKKTE